MGDCMRKSMEKSKFWLFKSMAILLVLLCSFLSGCTQQEKNAANDAAQSGKKIVVGVDDYPPFNFPDENGNPTGIDIELAKEAFGRMGYSVRFTRIDWDHKDALLASGDIDCVWSCFSMKGRADRYKWAGPYLVSKQVVAVQNSSDIKTLADLQGKVVAVQSSTKPEEIFTETKDPRLQGIAQLYSVEARDMIYAMLGKGYVDAVAAHASAINQYNKDFSMNYRILEEPLTITGVGVAFYRKDNRGLAEELQKTLEQMREDGTTKKIVEKYLDDADAYLEVDKLEQ